jgi:2-hydroxychromene-2-carboxylate isomerase
MTDEPQIEYFYSAHSAFAYLGAWELSAISARTGWRIQHRPFDFWPVVGAAGGLPVKERSRAHIDYFFGRELRRWAEWRDLPILRHRPTHHDAPLALASGAIIAAEDQADALSRAILQAHWRDDADISDRALLIELAEDLGLNGPALLASAESPAVEEAFRSNTEEAIRRSVFGSPTYFIRDDMFYGQDRLEMVERAIREPFGD